MKELGCVVLGDRLVFLEYLKLLKKHKRDADRSRSLWSATTPVPKLPYHKNCGQFCFHVSCHGDGGVALDEGVRRELFIL